MTLDEARAFDAADPLRPLRDRFALPEEVIYLNGNSLGALPKATAGRVGELVEDQWGGALIGAWNKHGWIDMPQRLGAQVAKLIGVHPHEVIVADSTSVNLFKLLVAAARLSERSDIVTEAGNFHTDLHIAAGVADLLGLSLRVASRDEVEAAVGRDTNLLLLTHVHYKTAERFDMAGVTARARVADARTIWDLSHSIGAVPLDLHRDGVELAVGCGYKYLNGGPGAPAFLYVAEHLHERLRSPLQGWMGHAKPFAFTDDYAPAEGVSRFLAGTPPIIGMAALEAGLDTFQGVSMKQLWAKSVRLFDLFHALAARDCPELECVSPTEPDQRGSHISFRHLNAFELCQALIAEGVIGDFRAPDVIRFGITPLYLGAEEIVRAVEIMATILREGSWRDPRFAVRGKVT